MEWVVVLIEAIICVASYVLADYMVTHRNGLAKKMLIGRDASVVMLEMLVLAVSTFDGKKRGDTKLKEYTLSKTVENGQVTKVVVETEFTILTYTKKEGERYINKGFTETGATIVSTVLMIIFATCLFAICSILFL